jgi:hypothetical protein
MRVIDKRRTDRNQGHGWCGCSRRRRWCGRLRLRSMRWRYRRGNRKRKYGWKMIEKR